MIWYILGGIVLVIGGIVVGVIICALVLLDAFCELFKR